MGFEDTDAPRAPARAAPGGSPRDHIRGVKRPTQRRSREYMDAVLRAAGELIEEAGRDDFTIRALADRAQVSASWLYRYFPEKSAVIEAVMLDFIEKSLDVIPGIEQEFDSWQEAVELRAAAFSDFYRSARGLRGAWFARARTGLVEEQNRLSNDIIADQFAEMVSELAIVSYDELWQLIRLANEVSERLTEYAYELGPAHHGWIDRQNAHIFQDIIRPCFES